ncbi:DNA replication/repair protein RecF [Thiosulfativibrio zosterae]|uniref:DNA replication and repair protein RecF n=1 Tax=Thiosulfativibrio zosterae TaxID=2675053 RepID=A0A6F8PJM2_9GAMM|nr:DNA replication/repair protein RecF [Thiosulfativibrio zosterae]BBP42257.1 DNA replication and repair protein RecF [Thiosulfativibrio zosterae]
MAKITQFSLQNFRNFDQAWLKLAPGLNLIVGDNAAGKTSLIEGIWVLATGRSFRTVKPSQLIQQTHADLTLFAEVEQDGQTHKLGLNRTEHSSTLRLNGETIHSQALLANKLPVQLLTPESHRLLEEGPKARRQFLDWGCFHQYPTFSQAWRHYQRILKQRNHALRQKLPKAQTTLWDAQLLETAEQVHQIRQAYTEQLKPYLDEFCQAMMPELQLDIQLGYKSGWPKNAASLAQLLQDHYAKDAQQGFTQYGCHRADLSFKLDGQDALVKLSRGQQKLFVCALLLAQASVYEKHSNAPVIMLIDDLPAELDAQHRLTLLKLLDCLNIQHIISTTAEELVSVLNPKTTQIFQVKHGQIISD